MILHLTCKAIPGLENVCEWHEFMNHSPGAGCMRIKHYYFCCNLCYYIMIIIIILLYSSSYYHVSHALHYSHVCLVLGTYLHQAYIILWITTSPSRIKLPSSAVISCWLNVHYTFLFFPTHSLGFPWAFPVRSLGVPWAFPGRFLDFPSAFPGRSIGVPWTP